MQLDLPEKFEFLFTEHGTYRYRASHGGRGSAKSHSMAAALVVKARTQPLRILCARETQKSIKDSVKRLLDDKISDCGFGGFFDSTETEIRGVNGSLFTFAGLRNNPDTVKSTEGIDIAWVDEAGRVSQKSWDILIPTVRKPCSEIWASWNPEKPTDPVDAMFRGSAGAPPRSIVVEANWSDNPFFPEVLRQEMEWDRKRDPDKYAWVWEGKYQKSSEARVFKNWRIEDFETPDDAEFKLGADWGFAVDPTVLVRCYVKGRSLFVDREVYKVGCEIDHTPALFDGLDPGNPRMARQWNIRADSARPETISYMRRNGYPKIEKALKGAGSVEDGIEFLKSYDIIVHSRCRHTIDELTLYSFKTDPLTAEVLPILEDKQNHVVDALRYAAESLRRAKPKALVGTYLGR